MRCAVLLVFNFTRLASPLPTSPRLRRPSLLSHHLFSQVPIAAPQTPGPQRQADRSTLAGRRYECPAPRSQTSYMLPSAGPLLRFCVSSDIVSRSNRARLRAHDLGGPLSFSSVDSVHSRPPLHSRHSLRLPRSCPYLNPSRTTPPTQGSWCPTHDPKSCATSQSRAWGFTHREQPCVIGSHAAGLPGHGRDPLDRPHPPRCAHLRRTARLSILNRVTTPHNKNNKKYEIHT